MKHVIKSFGNSHFSGVLKDTEWDFNSCETLEDRVDMARALRAVLTAMDQVGWLEHTSDWDPYLIIKLKGDEEFNSFTGYYDIEKVDITHLWVDAPGPEDLQDDDLQEVAMRFYEEKEGVARLMIPLEVIEYIKIGD
jgi:hypothetical protein